ncbi:MAG: class I SAM-dependent methyltransferase [Tahibacter sp.]
MSNVILPGGLPSRRVTGATLVSALEQFFGHRPMGGDPYLDAKKALRAGPAEMLRVYEKVRGQVGSGQRVLDWGCRYGVWSHLLRSDIGESLQLDGCDVCAPQEYADFHALSAMRYQQIRHPWTLEYADQSFDAVFAGGTLEHVPNDGASLTELWRVIKTDGRLLITHLPNRYSWSECLSRRWFPAQAHQRRYHLKSMRERLLQHGFEPLRWGYHQIAPASLPERWRQSPRLARLIDALQGFNRFERIAPFNRLSATLWFVARRRDGF